MNPRCLLSAPSVGVLVLGALGALSGPVHAHDGAGVSSSRRGFALSAGFSELLVLGPVSGETMPMADLVVEGKVYHALHWAGGARLGFGPVSPEAFARISNVPRSKSWLPAVGLEVGVSDRAQQDTGDVLLAELRSVARDGVFPMYVAFHAVPLRFEVWDTFRLTVLQLTLGTYIAPLGRFTRVEVGVVGVGMVL